MKKVIIYNNCICKKKISNKVIKIHFDAIIVD